MYLVEQTETNPKLSRISQHHGAEKWSARTVNGRLCDRVVITPVGVS